MRKNIIFIVVFLIFTASFWFYYSEVIRTQPAAIVELQDKLAEKKRQLLSAQIISKNMQNVNELIFHNLVEDLSDSLAQSASIPFLNYLTGLIDDLDMILISMKPLNVIKWDQRVESQLVDQEYIEIPYNMTILASYKQFGKFLEELEKYPRLIRVTQIILENPLDASVYEGEISGKPNQHKINLEIQTITILKASFKGGSKQYN